MFQFHAQLKEIESSSFYLGELGKLRLVGTSFGISKEAEGDFRYVKGAWREAP